MRDAARLFIVGAAIMIISVRCGSKDMAALAVFCFVGTIAYALVDLVELSINKSRGDDA